MTKRRSPEQSDDFQVFALPEKKMRLSFVVGQTEYMRLLALATQADESEMAVLSTVLTLGLSLLEGGAGRELLDALSLRRFLEGS